MKIVPQVDDSDSFLEFPGFSDPQKARFHVMDCLVCIHQIPTLGSHRQILPLPDLNMNLLRSLGADPNFNNLI